jgi:hypothetical protein
MNSSGKHEKSNALMKTSQALAVSVLCFAAATALAQVSTTRTSDGAMLSHTQPKVSTVLPKAQSKVEEPLPPGATVVYSNLGTGTSVYNSGTGWTEAGAEANDYPLAEAMSFTPSSNFLLLRIDVGVTYLQGTNGMKLILAEDAQGVPGKTIYSAHFGNLPAFGTCCTVETAKVPANRKITLESGKTYWLYPLPADTTSYLIWNLDTTNLDGNGAVSESYGSSWTTASLSPFGAFDVYGMASH